MLYDLLLIFTDTVGFVNYVYDCDVVYCISLISCVVIRLSLVLSSSFCRAMLSCGMCSFVCVCVRHVRTFFHKTNKHNFRFFSPSGSHTILVFPHQTAWQYSDANPPPLTRSSNAGGVGRNRYSEPISGFTASCEAFQRQVQYT